MQADTWHSHAGSWVTVRSIGFGVLRCDRLPHQARKCWGRAPAACHAVILIACVAGDGSCARACPRLAGAGAEPGVLRRLLLAGAGAGWRRRGAAHLVARAAAGLRADCSLRCTPAADNHSALPFGLRFLPQVDVWVATLAKPCVQFRCRRTCSRVSP